jgi:hypothetical protein
MWMLIRPRRLLCTALIILLLSALGYQHSHTPCAQAALPHDAVRLLCIANDPLQSGDDSIYFEIRETSIGLVFCAGLDRRRRPSLTGRIATKDYNVLVTQLVARGAFSLSGVLQNKRDDCRYLSLDITNHTRKRHVSLGFTASPRHSKFVSYILTSTIIGSSWHQVARFRGSGSLNWLFRDLNP